VTSISEIKRGNRKTELALRDAEFLSTLARLNGHPYPAAELLTLWKQLLVNQFHDILPGSSIAEVNDLAIATFHQVQEQARAQSVRALSMLAPHGHAALLLTNSLSWDRTGELTLSDLPTILAPVDQRIPAQWVDDITGAKKLVLRVEQVPALGTASLPVHQQPPANHPSPFVLQADTLETPHALAKFDKAGRITSYVLKMSGREVVREGGALNSLLFGEDVPEAWDNWDIDRDQILKMHAISARLEQRVVANGPLQLRIRSVFQLGADSRLTQDMVFHATTPQVDFETMVDWHETHMLLKAGFELNVLADTARHEIQYGHVERPTHTNLPQDRARFEVCAHKWSDLSDNGFGVALLNDCKYGVGVNRNEIQLTLIKSGTHPDARGDAGTHVFTYSILPHTGPFSVEAVVRPAYELNTPVTTLLTTVDAQTMDGLLSVDSPNVIVESVKWAEQSDAFVVRLYEAGKIGGNVTVEFNTPVQNASETNLLEEKPHILKMSDQHVSFNMRPFEIKTLVVHI
jgi:alpha-mannosidase